MTTSSVSNVDQILGVSCTIQNRFITITETMLNDVLGLPTANFVSVPTEEERTTFFHQGGYLKSYMSLISQKNGTFPSPVCPMSLHQRLPDSWSHNSQPEHWYCHCREPINQLWASDHGRVPEDTVRTSYFNVVSMILPTCPQSWADCNGEGYICQ